jgi:hypothetical protein
MNLLLLLWYGSVVSIVYHGVLCVYFKLEC